MQDARQDMQLLFDVEYGVPREVVLRLAGTCMGAVLMHFYADWYMPFSWCLGYLAAHALHYRFVTSRLDRAVPRDLVVAGLLYLVVVFAFMWLPAYLAMQHEPIMIYVGAVLMTSTMVYQIRRGDRILWLNWAQILMFASLVLLVLISQMHHFHGPLARIGAVIVTLAGFGYVALAMLYARSSRLEMEATAERLAQDQKMSAIGRLAGGVAHDFNNMLTVVKGNLELYHLLDDPAERRAAVAEAQVAAQRAEEVVHQLLIFARKAPIRLRVVDANEAVAATMALARTMVPEHICRDFTPWPKRLPLEIDDGQLATALLNLIKNAVDAMPKSGHLHVSTALEVVQNDHDLLACPELSAGNYVRLCVRDTGCGIDKDDLIRVADPFFTTKPPGQGTGLGLSMVAGFVQGAGGGLRINSTPEGTEVTLFLPALEAHRPSPATKNAAPDEGGVLVGQ